MIEAQFGASRFSDKFFQQDKLKQPKPSEKKPIGKTSGPAIVLPPLPVETPFYSQPWFRYSLLAVGIGAIGLAAFRLVRR